MASALSVLVVQGLLTALGVALGEIVDDAAVAALTATGGVLLVGVAIRLLRIRPLPVADLLPALVVAPLLVTSSRVALSVARAGDGPGRSPDRDEESVRTTARHGYSPPHDGPTPTVAPGHEGEPACADGLPPDCFSFSSASLPSSVLAPPRHSPTGSRSGARSGHCGRAGRGRDDHRSAPAASPASVTDAAGAWLVEVPGPGPYTVELDVATLPDGTTPPIRNPIETVADPGTPRTLNFSLGERERNVASFWDRAAQLAVEGIRLGW